jgi:hypothetical protein
MQLRIKAGRFTMVNGTLYKRGFTLPLLKCVSPKEGNYILREIHEGVCGNHSRARVLAHKAIKAGFYWPNMSKDSTTIVRNCDKCDSPTIRQHHQATPRGVEFNFLSVAFSQWGVDIVGPLPRGKGGV